MGTGAQLMTSSRAALVVVCVLLGCRPSSDDGSGPSSFVPNAPPPTNQIPDPPDDATGPELYAMQCATCHGPAGYGGVAPVLAGWDKGEDVWMPIVVRTMPVGRPEACDGICAKKIFDALAEIAPPVEDPCEGGERLPPRRLRLLTRRELRNTIEAIVPAPACDEIVFSYAPSGARPNEVLVSGSFNGWGEDATGGAWPLVWSDVRGAFVLRRTIADGTYSYKFIVDGNWIADPSSAEREPDGFGGENSVLRVACAGVEDAADPYDRLPEEIRPEGFPFDDHEASAVVTTVHVDEHFEATRSISGRVTRDLDRFVTCNPAASSCAEDFVRDFGARAFRRPLTADEITRYTAIVEGGATFSDGVEQAVRVMLASPRFLYRTELGIENGDDYLLEPYEIASALSYFLWAAPPTAELYEAAAAGELTAGSARRAVAMRMLEDPRAEATLGAFGVQWLGAEKVTTVDKHPGEYGDLNDEVRASMRDATARFFSTVALDGSESLDTLYTADFGYVDDTLARFHGWTSPGAEMTRTTLPPARHAGVLAHGSVLASYAHSDQTSPILRGLLVRERLLCQVFGVPPPDAGGVPNVDPTATTRERFRQHSENPRCHACHRYLDEVGFAFEAFDTVGRHRTEENGHPVDTSGVLEDVEAFGDGTETPFVDLKELGAQIAASDRAAECFVTQVWRYQTGRMNELEDACSIKSAADRFRAGGRNIRTLLLDMIADDGFVRRRAE